MEDLLQECIFKVEVIKMFEVPDEVFTVLWVLLCLIITVAFFPFSILPVGIIAIGIYLYKHRITDETINEQLPQREIRKVVPKVTHHKLQKKVR
jgi:hypothetical protein